MSQLLRAASYFEKASIFSIYQQHLCETIQHVREYFLLAACEREYFSHTIAQVMRGLWGCKGDQQFRLY